MMDILLAPEKTIVKFLRAHWEARRWGRGAETPMFEFQFGVKEVSPSLLQEVSCALDADPEPTRAQRGLGLLIWLLWCTVYTWVWRAEFKLRQRFYAKALFIVLSLSIILAFEAASSLLGNIGIVIGHEVHFPVWVDGIMLGLAFLLAAHHFKEWKLRNREMETPKALKDVLTEHRGFLQAEPKVREMQRDEYLADLLKSFRALLEKESKRRITLSLMKSEKNEPLKTVCSRPPDAGVVETRQFTRTEGAAGKAWELGAIVYIPSTRHRGGINADTFEVLGLPYVEVGTEDKFRSLLCVPVKIREDLLLVINILSDKQRAFSPLDFAIARLAKTFIEMAY